MSEKPKAPPIGIQPQWLWREIRVIALTDAVARYVVYGRDLEIVKEWNEEIATHVQWLSERNDNGHQG